MGDLVPAGRALDPRFSRGTPGRRLMRSVVSIDAGRPAGARLRLAHDVERWPSLLPHYLRVARFASASRVARSWRSSSPCGRSCRSSGSGCRSRGARGRGASPTACPPAVRPSGRRDGRHGRDVAHRAERGRAAASRSSTTSDRPAGLGRRSSIGSSCGRSRRERLRRSRRSPRPRSPPSPVGRRLRHDRPTPRLDHRHRHGHPDRDRARRVLAGRAARPVAGQDASTASTRRPSARRSRPRSTTSTRLDFMPPQTARQLDRFSQFGLAAGQLALADAGLDPGAPTAPPNRHASGSISGRRSAALPTQRSSTSATWREGSVPWRRTSRSRSSAARRRPTSASRSTVHGPILSTANSCASGAVAIGEAARGDPATATSTRRSPGAWRCR